MRLASISMLRLAWLATGIIATSAFALDPQTAITQFVHTSWTEKDGAPNNLRALAQTQDGYLWIGATAGLFRFDGVRFTAYEPPAGESFPATRVQRLLATRDGALWIVWAAGAVSRLQNGHLTSYSTRDGLPATAALVESVDGTIIAATASGLSRFEGGAWKDVTKEWNFPARQSRQLYFDKIGTLWVQTEDRVVYLPRGQSRFVDPGNPAGLLSNFAQDPDGAIWVSEVGRSAHTTRTARDQTRETEVRVGATWVLFDRDGSLWVGSVGDGLRRVPYPDRISGKRIAQFGPEAEQFTAKNGLSSAIVLTMLEDREGNIWCATTNGLDRFRQGAFLPVDVPHPDMPRGVLATKDGNLWTFSSNPVEIVRVSPGGGNEIISTSLATGGFCEDESGALWILREPHQTSRLYRFRQGRLAPVPLPDDPGIKQISDYFMITCDHAGGLWIFDPQQGLFRFTDRGLTKIVASADPSYRFTNLYADGRGRVWLSHRDSIEMFGHGSTRRFGASDGVTVGSIFAFAEDKAGNVWVAGDGGLAKFDHDRFRPLLRSNGLPAQPVFGLAEDDAGYWWIVCDAGLLRIRAEELEHALSDPAYRVPYELFNLLDGLPARPSVNLLPVLAKTADGRIWIATANGIAYVDPRRIPRNPIPPPVQVETVKVNGKEIASADGLALSPGSNDLEIDYTALSLTIPERVRFKYKLEGYDSDWKDVGGRRQAYYGGLGPKKYRFRVIAANESGVWNEAGAAWNFRVLPAYYQTIWFETLCVAAVGAMFCLLYMLRLRQVTNRIRAGFRERMDERTRIAEELHDTVVQAISGSTMLVENAAEKIPDSLPVVKGALLRAVDKLDAALNESRAALKGLRSSGSIDNDLAKQLSDVANDKQAAGTTFRLVITGESRVLRPAIHYEVFRIGSEAITNAMKHSGANSIQVELEYVNGLRMMVRDNGKGIPEQVLHSGKEGHFGLEGMRGRADRIGASLEVHSRARAGTEVCLTIPAHLAFSLGASNSSFLARAFSRITWFRDSA
jgi:signal transduction histidine kinase/ligand-binding sensor domain-containing protein